VFVQKSSVLRNGKAYFLVIGMTVLFSYRSKGGLAKYNLLHHLNKVDFIVAVLNNPSPSMWDEIEPCLKAASGRIYPSIRLCEVFNWNMQVQWVTESIMLLDKLGADWIINDDDDEFYTGDIRGAVQRAHADGFNQIVPSGYYFFETMKDFDGPPPMRMVYRDQSGKDYPASKPIHKVKGFTGTVKGNHSISMDGPVVPKKDDSVVMHHYKYRIERGFKPLENIETYVFDDSLRKEMTHL
jgi:hypothetical protein